MKSCIYKCKITHSRIRPKKHYFDYNQIFYAIDLDELSHLSQNIKFFSHNKFNVFSIKDKDYLDSSSNTIKEKLNDWLIQSEYPIHQGRTILLTMPRIFNRIFNPINFYFLLDRDNEYSRAIIEVNNTFGESHLYILNDLTDDGGLKSASKPKQFHVSPFNSMDGYYNFYLSEIGDGIQTKIELIRDGNLIMYTNLNGTKSILNNATLIKSIFPSLISNWLTVPKIMVNAAFLYFISKLKFHPKPTPISKHTYRSPKQHYTKYIRTKFK